ncbi:MAG: type II toxin-antitoxin system RelE/ParE family toxin [Candidatus Woesearchaeota archaeon]
MHTLEYKPSFYKDLEKTVKDKLIRKQIISKTLEMENRAPLGKKLENCPYWSIHINKFRVVYEIEENTVTFLRVLPRKKQYRELK